MSDQRYGEVEPDLRAALGAIPNFDTLSTDTLAGFRDLLKGVPVEPGVDGDISVDVVTAVGTDGHEVACILHRPRADGPVPVILNIHGGGYVMGDAAREAPAMHVLASALGCAVLSVDYRLAPESPFPAPLDDCAAALQWLVAQSDNLGFDKNRIAIRGVSAGGGLAAGLMLRTLSVIGVRPCLLMLIYPMLDNGAAPPDRCGQHVWTRRANEFGWSAYLGSHAGHPPVEAVPGLASDLSGFPPTFLAVGDIDLFVAENLAFASRVMQAQVPLELHVYPGAYHGFNLVPGAGWSSAFQRDCQAALSRAFAAGENRNP